MCVLIFYTAVGEAVKLAQQLQSFPQSCMRADRQSAYYAAYNSSSHDDAIDNEWYNGIKVIKKESVKGEL